MPGGLRPADRRVPARRGAAGPPERLAPSDVDDIVQEVCVRLFEHAGTIREPRALLAWLTMVTRRAARRSVGAAAGSCRPTSTTDRPSPGSTEDQAMRSFERREVSDGVARRSARLDAEDRRVLLLLDRRRNAVVRRCQHGCAGRSAASADAAATAPATALDPAVRRLRLAS